MCSTIIICIIVLLHRNVFNDADDDGGFLDRETAISVTGLPPADADLHLQ